MYTARLVVTAITTDRIREADAARRISRTTIAESAEPRRARRLRSFATRIAAPGVR
jgi:hypothetical protein